VAFVNGNPTAPPTGRTTTINARYGYYYRLDPAGEEHSRQRVRKTRPPINENRESEPARPALPEKRNRKGAAGRTGARLPGPWAVGRRLRPGGIGIPGMATAANPCF